jgi:putative exporter of polyketide antibiotics
MSLNVNFAMKRNSLVIISAIGALAAMIAITPAFMTTVYAQTAGGQALASGQQALASGQQALVGVTPPPLPPCPTCA